LDSEGKPREFYDAVVGGLSVGVPGLLRMLELAHKEHGKLPWERLFLPAITLAEEGFQVSPRLHQLLEADQYLRETKAAMGYYYNADGDPAAVGTTLINRPLAQVLRAVAKGGSDAFYRGKVAEDISAAVRDAPRNPATLTVADIGNYKAVRREALCRPYRTSKVCGMPPPTSGGIAALQILGILSHFDLSELEPESLAAAHLFAEASRLAYADRGKYVADADFVEVPVDELLGSEYLRGRAALISTSKILGVAAPGTLGGAAVDWPPDASLELPSTSHMVVVDAAGNAVSMTNSIESAFGSRIMADGFLLNNELTDFSFVPEEDGVPVANRVEAGKRPRSSMSPMLVFDAQGKFKMAIGSPGGSRIILYTTRALLSVLDWNMGVQAAINRPHVINRNGVTEVELIEGKKDWTDAMSEGLRRLGHEVVATELNSGLHGIVAVEGGGYRGGADPRREGVMLGD
jgi:gamma-glutamyltranspeptidase/glutathione hydrolase